MHVQIVHLALGNENGGVHQVYESASCLAWGLVFGRRKIGVLSTSFMFLTRVGMYADVDVCIHTHTHTLNRCSTRLFAQESG